ncbi:hypothetical protein [Streptomyces filamentosus]|uniref:hypothetical protein n=1 Tax=Streptomyces filamentosus TaxID=67294 RepID=UPI0033EA9D42
MQQDRTSTTAPTHRDRAATTSTLVRPRRPDCLNAEFISDRKTITRRLDRVPPGTLATLTGTVTVVSMFGTGEQPRALVTLTGTAGDVAQCIVDTEHYLDLCSFLVTDTTVRVSGKVRRPVAGETGYVEVLAVQTVDEMPSAVSA